MRFLLLAASALVFLAGFQLFILSEYTDLYFAWTIQPPLTAAFLGAGYFASFLLEFLSAREKEWSSARAAVPAVFTFTTLTLIATLLNANRFHFNSPNVFAYSAAWFWLAIYVIVPPAMLAVWIKQQRVKGEDSLRSTPLPFLMRIVLAVQSVSMIAAGIGLFIAPTVLAPFWPWKLTTLTSQAIGAWLIGLGVFALHSALENELRRIKAGMVSFLGFGILELFALLRYPANVDWTDVGAWIYLVSCSAYYLWDFMPSYLVVNERTTSVRDLKGINHCLDVIRERIENRTRTTCIGVLLNFP